MAIPSPGDAICILDASVKSSITQVPGVVGGVPTPVVTEWHDLSGNGLDFTVEATGDNEMQLIDGFATNRNEPDSNTFVCASPVLPDTGDWTWTLRFINHSYGADGWLFSQYMTGPSGRLALRAQSSTDILDLFIGSTSYGGSTNFPQSLRDIPHTVTFARRASDGRYTMWFNGVLIRNNPGNSRTPLQVPARLMDRGLWSVARMGVWNQYFEGEDIAKIEKWAEFGLPDGPVLSSPHLINHFDPSQLLSSPHLLGSFP